MAGTRVPQNDGLIITKNWSAMENDFRYRWCASRRRQNMILYKRKLIKREEARNEKFYSIPNYFGFWPHSLSLSAWQRHTPTYRKSATNRMEMQKHHFFAFFGRLLSTSEFANSLAQLNQPHTEQTHSSDRNCRHANLTLTTISFSLGLNGSHFNASRGMFSATCWHMRILIWRSTQQCQYVWRSRQ